MKRTERICILSLMAAMCVALMSLSLINDTLDFSLAILAGLVVAVADVEFGKRDALTVFAVSAILGLVLPVKTSALFFVLIAGWYPVAQSRLVTVRPVIARIIKLLIVNSAIALDILISVYLLKIMALDIFIIAIFVLGNAVFFLYDELLNRLVIWYIVKLRPRIGFGKRRR